jgi:hypothetical protein
VSLLERALVRLATDLAAADAKFALVGGFAVSLRAEPRTTRDIDLAIAVDDDDQATAIVQFLSRARGYSVGESLEHEPTGRLGTQRLVARVPGEGRVLPVTVDLLFASSGIEREIVAAADRLETCLAC